MSAARLLLIPSFTELEWGIRPRLEEWAEVASFDMPGVGGEPLPSGLDLESVGGRELLQRWREAGAARGLAEADQRGWESFVAVTDGYGTPSAVRLAGERPGAVLGIAIGHASLSHSSEGERAPAQAGTWDAMGQLLQQGNEAFVRYGIAQMTRGGIDEETAQEMIERFPDGPLLRLAVDALSEDPEPIGEQLAALDTRLLLAKHEGCLGRTDEGFEDIVAAFPDARTVICEQACSSSPEFAEALRAVSEALRPADP